MSAGDIAGDAAVGCLSNEIGCALLLLAVTPVLIALLGCVVLDAFLLPIRLLRWWV